MKKGLLACVVLMMGVALATGPAAATWVQSSIPATTGVYDENTFNTNQVDFEVDPATGSKVAAGAELAAFKATMASAFAADLGGVLTWDWPALNGGKYGTEGGEIIGPFTIPYGVSQTDTIVVDIPSIVKYQPGNNAAMISGRDGNIGVDATSGNDPAVSSYYWIDSVMYSPRYADASILGEFWMEFPEGMVAELGITAIPAQTADWLAPNATRAGADYTQQVTVTFSGGGSQTLSATMSGGNTGDTFFHFYAPAGQTIVRLDALDPDHTGLTVYDDLGLIMVGGSTPPDPEWHPGDANKDGIVDLQDFGILKDNYGMTTGAVWDNADFNDDGGVDLQDFGILKEHYGHTAGDNPLTAVPEPATMLGLAVGGLVAIARKRRGR